MNKLFRAYLLGIGCLLGLFSAAPVAAKSSTKSMLQCVLCQLCDLNKRVITLQNSGCTPTAITSAQEITQPGFYCLANDITVGDNEVGIKISANNVVLDMNNRSIVGTHKAGQIGLNNTGAWNIVVGGGTIRDCEIGVNDTGSYNQFFDIKSGSNLQGFIFKNATATYVQNCWAIENYQTGFLLDSSSYIIVYNSKALMTNNVNRGRYPQDMQVSGVLCKGCQLCHFEDCVIDGIASQATDASNFVSGVLITGGDDIRVLNCSIRDVSGSSVPAYGIYLSALSPVFLQEMGDCYVYPKNHLLHAGAFAPQIVSLAQGNNAYYVVTAGTPLPGEYGSQVLVFTTNAQSVLPVAQDVDQTLNEQCFSVAWSSDGSRLAIGASGKIFIYSATYNGSLALVHETTISGIVGNVVALSWSPDGGYLAVGFAQTVRVYDNAGAPVGLAVTIASGSIATLSWFPNKDVSAANNLIAVGVTGAGGADPAALLYEFTGSSLALRDFIARDVSTFPGVQALAWATTSPRIVFGTPAITPSPTVSSFEAYTVDLAKTFTQKVVSLAQDATSAIAWAHEGRFVALATNTGLMGEILLKDSFERTYTTVCSMETTGASCVALSWSCDDTYLAMIGTDTSNRGLVCVLNGLFTPATCTIQKNSVNSVNSFSVLGSIGVHANSFQNYVAENSASSAIPYHAVANKYIGSQSTAAGVDNVALQNLGSYSGTKIHCLKNSSNESIYYKNHSWDKQKELKPGYRAVDAGIPNIDSESDITNKNCFYLNVAGVPYFLFDGNWTVWRLEWSPLYPTKEYAKDANQKEADLEITSDHALIWRKPEVWLPCCPFTFPPWHCQGGGL